VNVLVLSHMFPTSPESRKGIFVLEQTRALQKLGVNSTVVAPSPWIPAAFKNFPGARKYQNITRLTNVAGVEAECVPTLSFPEGAFFAWSGLISYLSCRSAVRRIIRRKNIQLIHAHTIMPDGFAAVLLARELHLPLVCTLHGSDVKLYPLRSRAIAAVTTWALARIQHLIAVSNDVGQIALSQGARKRPTVIHNGASQERFSPGPKSVSREQLGLPLDRAVVLFVGNLIPLKGTNLLVRALAQVTHKPILVLVGGGPCRAELQDLAAQLGVECIFAGGRPHDEIATWLTASDCLVLPSLSEGLPTILAEAMMCRTPIVATAVGGTPEIVSDGRTGLLVPPSNVQAISGAVSSVLSMEPSQIDTMLDRAQHFAQRRLTWDINACDTLKVYEKALSDNALNAHASGASMDEAPQHVSNNQLTR